MHLRHPILPATFTIVFAVLAWWVLSVYIPVSPMQKLTSVAAHFEGERAMQYTFILTQQFKDRVVGSDQGFAAADYVINQFSSFGLEIETQDFREAGARSDGSDRGWYKGRNVIGILPGQGEGTVVLAAHRDCFPQASEGAYDNASGTATVIELARVLSKSGPHHYTYAFVALDGEEVGLAGARALMNSRSDVLKDIRLVVNLDMVGFKESNGLGLAHSQYLSVKTRALVASYFEIPGYGLFQPMQTRGSDALIFTLRGLPTLDICETRPIDVKYWYHSARDTYGQISADSIQRVGRIVEKLILQGDAIGAFVPSRGLVASNSRGVLTSWRFRLAGVFISVVFMIPLLFRFRPVYHAGKQGLTMLFMILLSGILAALSSLWSGSVWFLAFPILITISFMVLQVVALRRVKNPDPELGCFLISAMPPLLFTGTWILTGLWPLGVWTAVPAYLPAVLVTWKAGWGRHTLDIALLLPTVLLTWFIATGAWILAPLHAFPPTKLALFTAIYMAVCLIGIWGIFGRRPIHSAPALPSPIEIS